MPDRSRLSRAEVADRLLLQPQTIDTYRRRGIFPEPEGYVGRSPWWYAHKIDRWASRRRTRGEKIR